MQQTPLLGAYLIQLPVANDNRGVFVKSFHAPSLAEGGINFDLKESYYSFSHKNVIRGMHFQLPPHQHAKLVFCQQGAILDVIVDLRRNSPTYGQYFAQELSAQNNLAFYIPEGFAHGFKSLTDGALTYYLVSSAYSREHDTGILYSSIGMYWGIANPILSARDASFLALSDFKSPF